MQCKLCGSTGETYNRLTLVKNGPVESEWYWECGQGCGWKPAPTCLRCGISDIPSFPVAFMPSTKEYFCEHCWQIQKHGNPNQPWYHKSIMPAPEEHGPLNPSMLGKFKACPGESIEFENGSKIAVKNDSANNLRGTGDAKGPDIRIATSPAFTAIQKATVEKRCEWYAMLNVFLWPVDLPGKPEGYDSLPDRDMQTNVDKYTAQDLVWTELNRMTPEEGRHDAWARYSNVDMVKGTKCDLKSNHEEAHEYEFFYTGEFRSASVNEWVATHGQIAHAPGGSGSTMKYDILEARPKKAESEWPKYTLEIVASDPTISKWHSNKICYIWRKSDRKWVTFDCRGRTLGVEISEGKEKAITKDEVRAFIENDYDEKSEWPKFYVHSKGVHNCLAKQVTSESLARSVLHNGDIGNTWRPQDAIRFVSQGLWKEVPRREFERLKATLNLPGNAKYM